MRDAELLKRFAAGDAGAFGEIVGRHRGWVYSVCWRRLRDEGKAEDATQVVFLALMREAGKVAGYGTIEGWLHRVSRYTAMKILRDDVRRVKREREAGMMRGEMSREEWEGVEGRLERAMDGLGRKDREVILLRFYRGMSHAEVGEAVGVSEEAAKKRAARAVEKLRGVIGVHGVTGEGVGAGILAYGMVSVPTELAGKLEGILRGGASGKIQVLAKGVLKMMGHVKLAMVVGCVAAGVVLVSVVVAVPVMSGGDGGKVAATGPAVAVVADTPVVAAERRELVAVQKVLKSIDQKMQIVQLTIEFLMAREEWQRREARLELRLAVGKAARVAVAEKWLAAVQELNKRIEDRRSVDADPTTINSGIAFVAEAEVVVERAKSGEEGDLGL